MDGIQGVEEVLFFELMSKVQNNGSLSCWKRNPILMMKIIVHFIWQTHCWLTSE